MSRRHRGREGQLSQSKMNMRSWSVSTMLACARDFSRASYRKRERLRVVSFLLDSAVVECIYVTR